jgi:hypothetical protein
MTNEPAVLSNTVAVGDESAALETGARSKLADAKGEFASRSEKVAGSWGAPEDVTVGSIRVPADRLPVDEDVVEAIVAAIKAGNVNALPSIHVWRKQTGNVTILVAGRNRLEATLEGPGDTVATVNLTPDQQSMFMHEAPKAFVPVPGGWGRLGSTSVLLGSVTSAQLQDALGGAWQNVAPKSLLRRINASRSTVPSRPDTG